MVGFSPTSASSSRPWRARLGNLRYLHSLADALLVREFRRFPLAQAETARVPVKMTLTDLQMAVVDDPLEPAASGVTGKPTVATRTCAPIVGSPPHPAAR